MGAALSELGIAVNHYFYLRALFERDGLTPAELSERIGMDRATVTNVLDTMQAQDLVRRSPHPHDRRRVCIFLTARGEGLREPVLDAMAAVNATAVKGIPAAEFEHFRTTIEKIVANLTSQPC
jgi:MarR family transcriptional regulator, organic hydroperoxide resistance regulator